MVSTALPYRSDIWIESTRREYLSGAYRARLMRDLILRDADRLGDHLTFLDIGCGRGFDADPALQESLVQAAGRYVGVEPDNSITPAECISEVHRCILEDAPLPAGSIDIAFSIMVLEHLSNPQAFWTKLHSLLADGGIFWAMTVDSRHWLCTASLWTSRLRIKDRYLSLMLGERGKTRYENYPVYYRCNTPREIKKHARAFSSVTCLNLARVGQCDWVLPAFMRPISHCLESSSIRRGKPGALMLVRAQK